MAEQRVEMKADELLAAYARGERDFYKVNLDSAELNGVDLQGASFYGASLRGTNFHSTNLTHVQFKAADLTNACLSQSRLIATDLIGATFHGADLTRADLTGACLNRTDCTGADMRRTNLGNATLNHAIFLDAKIDRAHISETHFGAVDVSTFCDAKALEHSSPSDIDSRTVMKTYQHPRLKRFLLDCGVPEIFAEYMIECACSLGEPLLRSLMQSTFISYGGPDEAFARKLYGALRAHSVVVFFFPEDATIGERIDNEVFRRLQEHDRVILICSRVSLDRAGVLNEIQETFDREARDGGANYLLPIMLDDYVLNEWRTNQPEFAERIRRRIVGDFRNAQRSRKAFDAALEKLLNALKTKRPTL